MLKKCCIPIPFINNNYTSKYVGTDKNFMAVSLLTCKKCNQNWLHFLSEEEGFSNSGKWYMIPFNNSTISTDQALELLSSSKTYFYGESYYNII